MYTSTDAVDDALVLGSDYDDDANDYDGSGNNNDNNNYNDITTMINNYNDKYHV